MPNQLLQQNLSKNGAILLALLLIGHFIFGLLLFNRQEDRYWQADKAEDFSAIAYLNKITVYSYPGCLHCEILKQDLKGAKLIFTELIIGKDIELEKLQQKLKEKGLETFVSTPLVDVNGTIFRRYPGEGKIRINLKEISSALIRSYRR